MGSGNVVAWAGVAEGDVWLAAGVSEIVVGGSDVCVKEGVPGGDVAVPVPLHAATENTSKSINRLIYDLLFIVYIRSIRIYNIPRIIIQITPKFLHMLLHHRWWTKLNK